MIAWCLWVLLAWAQDPAEEAAQAGAACEQGQKAACADAARRYAEGDGIPVDDFRAAQLYREGCRLEDSPCCLWLADAHREGVGAKLDTARANELYMQSCELGSGIACRKVGDVFILSQGMRTDGATAGIWYDMGCALGDAPSCTNAALWLERGDIAAANPEAARELLARGCRSGHTRGCAQLGLRYLYGVDVKKDLAAAVMWFNTSCAGSGPDPEGCRELGTLQRKGKGTHKDASGAEISFGRSCDANDHLGCRYLGELLHAEGQLGEALVATERGCQLGDKASCRRNELIVYRLSLLDQR